MEKLAKYDRVKVAGDYGVGNLRGMIIEKRPGRSVVKFENTGFKFGFKDGDLVKIEGELSADKEDNQRKSSH